MNDIKKIFSQNKAISIIAIILIGLIVHSTILNNPFKTLDDKASILNNDQIKSMENIKEIFTSSFFGGKTYYRPLVSLSFMLNYHFSKEDPFSYNLTNLVIHLLTAAMIFLLLNKILLPQGLSFLAALLFAVHPVHWEAVSNIPGRAILLSAFFSLSAFYLFALSRGHRHRYSYYLLSLLSFILSMLSKESGCMLPLVLLAYLVFLGDTRTKKPQQFFSVIPFFVLLASYLVLRKILGMTQIYYWPSLKMQALGVITFLRTIITYARIMLFPYGLHFDRSRMIFTSFSSYELWMTLIFYVISIFLLIKYRKRISNIVWFLLAWFFIELFPVSQITGTIGVTPGYISTAEHFLYVPSISLLVLLVISGVKIFEYNEEKKLLSPSFLKFIFVMFFFAMAIITFEQEIYSSQEFSMLERTLKYDPNNNRIRVSLALGYAERGLYPQAAKHFQEALRSDPMNVRARIGLGKALCDEGRYFEGINEYEKIQDAGGLKELLKKNLILSYNIVIKKYRDRIEEEKDNPGLYYSLGVVYAKKGDLKKAVILYEKALSLDPLHKEVLFNLASAYDHMQEWEKAREYYIRLVRLKGDLGELRTIANNRLEYINNLISK